MPCYTTRALFTSGCAVQPRLGRLYLEHVMQFLRSVNNIDNLIAAMAKKGKKRGISNGIACPVPFEK